MEIYKTRRKFAKCSLCQGQVQRVLRQPRSFFSRNDSKHDKQSLIDRAISFHPLIIRDGSGSCKRLLIDMQALLLDIIADVFTKFWMQVKVPDFGRIWIHKWDWSWEMLTFLLSTFDRLVWQRNLKFKGSLSRENYFQWTGQRMM